MINQTIGKLNACRTPGKGTESDGDAFHIII